MTIDISDMVIQEEKNCLKKLNSEKQFAWPCNKGHINCWHFICYRNS